MSGSPADTGTAGISASLAAYRWQGGAWRWVKMPHPTVLGSDRHGNPVFANALAPIPGTDQNWLAGDSRGGAVIMRTYRAGP